MEIQEIRKAIKFNEDSVAEYNRTGCVELSNMHQQTVDCLRKYEILLCDLIYMKINLGNTNENR